MTKPNSRALEIVMGAGMVALVVFVGIAAGLLLLVATVAVYLLVALRGVARIHRTSRFPTEPTLRDLRLDDPSIPDDARARIQEQRDILGSLGFELRGVVHRPADRGPGLFVALYHHGTSPAAAYSRVMPHRTAPAPTDNAGSTFTEFAMRYRSGESLHLSNEHETAPGMERTGVVHRMPDVRDVRRLYDYFLKLVDHHESSAGIRAEERQPLATGQAGESYLMDIRRLCEALRRAGLLEESDKPGVLRPSWRFAYGIAASRYSPIKEFLERRLLARSSRLQRTLDGDATRTNAERLGAAGGWTMFVAGIALMLAALLVCLSACAVAAMGMSVAWSLALRRGTSPGWRTLALGGAAVIILFAALTAGLGAHPAPGDVLLGQSQTLSTVGEYALPMAVLTAGTALMIQGFRVAASA